MAKENNCPEVTCVMTYWSFSASVCSRFVQMNVNKHLIFSYMAIRPPRSSSETIVHIFVTPFSSWNGYFIN